MRRGLNSGLGRNPNTDATAHVPPELDVVALVLRRDEAVADEEVDEDQAAVGLEFAVCEALLGLLDGHELYC